jgi:hypothetical protein
MVLCHIPARSRAWLVVFVTRNRYELFRLAPLQLPREPFECGYNGPPEAPSVGHSVELFYAASPHNTSGLISGAKKMKLFSTTDPMTHLGAFASGGRSDIPEPHFIQNSLLRAQLYSTGARRGRFEIVAYFTKRRG